MPLTPPGSNQSWQFKRALNCDPRSASAIVGGREVGSAGGNPDVYFGSSVINSSSPAAPPLGSARYRHRSIISAVWEAICKRPRDCPEMRMLPTRTRGIRQPGCKRVSKPEEQRYRTWRWLVTTVCGLACILLASTDRSVDGKPALARVPPGSFQQCGAAKQTIDVSAVMPRTLQAAPDSSRTSNGPLEPASLEGHWSKLAAILQEQNPMRLQAIFIDQGQPTIVAHGGMQRKSNDPLGSLFPVQTPHRDESYAFRQCRDVNGFFDLLWRRIVRPDFQPLARDQWVKQSIDRDPDSYLAAISVQKGGKGSLVKQPIRTAAIIGQEPEQAAVPDELLTKIG